RRGAPPLGIRSPPARAGYPRHPRPAKTPMQNPQGTREFREEMDAGVSGRELRRPDLLQYLQFLAGFEPDSLPWWNRYLGAGPRIPADSRLARLYVENAKAAELDPVAVPKRFLHALEDGLDRH